MSKRKIVRVFEVKDLIVEAPAAPAQKPSLMKKVAGIFGKQEEPAPEPEDEHGLKGDGDTSIQQVLGRIFTVPSDSRRCILFLNDSDLRSRYLTSGGEQKIAEPIDDKVFKTALKGQSKEALVNGATTFFQRIYTPDFDLDAITTSGWAPYAVLFNVKKAIWDEFVSAPDVEAKKAAFVKCISHKFYVAVLNIDKIKKANVGALTKPEDREAKFDVKQFITAYPIRSVIDAAREEWDAKTQAAPGEEAQSEEELVAGVVKKAVRYVWQNTKGGQLKASITKKRFEEGLLAILHDSPELKGREDLIGHVVHAFTNDPSVLKGKLHNLIGGIVPAPDDGSAPAPAAATPAGAAAPTMKSSDIDVDGQTADEIAAKLASAPKLAKQVMNNLKKYAI